MPSGNATNRQCWPGILMSFKFSSESLAHFSQKYTKKLLHIRLSFPWNPRQEKRLSLYMNFVTPLTFWVSCLLLSTCLWRFLAYYPTQVYLSFLVHRCILPRRLIQVFQIFCKHQYFREGEQKLAALWKRHWLVLPLRPICSVDHHINIRWHDILLALVLRALVSLTDAEPSDCEGIKMKFSCKFFKAGSYKMKAKLEKTASSTWRQGGNINARYELWAPPIMCLLWCLKFLLLIFVFQDWVLLM